MVTIGDLQALGNLAREKCALHSDKRYLIRRPDRFGSSCCPILRDSVYYHVSPVLSSSHPFTLTSPSPVTTLPAGLTLTVLIAHLQRAASVLQVFLPRSPLAVKSLARLCRLLHYIPCFIRVCVPKATVGLPVPPLLLLVSTHLFLAKSTATLPSAVSREGLEVVTGYTVAVFFVG